MLLNPARVPQAESQINLSKWGPGSGAPDKSVLGEGIKLWGQDREPWDL